MIEAIEGKDAAANRRLELDGRVAEDVVARGTPHFFINGKRLDGARPFEHFKALINHGLRRARTLIDEGIKPDQVYDHLQAEARSPGAPTKVEAELPITGRPARGPEDAQVIVHVFSDFECPYCRLAEQNLNELEQLYPKQLRIVWHDFPLPFHERALPLARAGHFAYRTGGSKLFWQLHGAIFALDRDEPRLSDAALETIASHLKIDWDKMSAAMNDDALDLKILADQQLAEGLGIRGTPALFIGDYLVTGAKPTEHLVRVVELVLARLESERTDTQSN